MEMKSFTRTRTWQDDPYGETHSRIEQVTTARAECASADMPKTLESMKTFTITGCTPDLTHPGCMIVTAEKIT